MTRSVQVQGQIAIIDPTGVVGAELETSLSPERIRARRADQARQALIQAPESIRQAAGDDGGRAARPVSRFGAVPRSAWSGVRRMRIRSRKKPG